MAQTPYRGNLLAKVFPFLSSQFGRTVVVQGQDQVNSFQSVDSVSVSGDANIPQMYFCQNVIPTAQGYKSVGYRQLLPPVGAFFDRVIPVRDPDMTRGWIGVTTTGRVYIYCAGDTFWTDITSTVTGWLGGDISVAYANGSTYLCLSKFNVYKVNVAGKTIVPVVLAGIVITNIVAITSSANYLILTDGISVYWSSTISPEDFVPSLVTGAGSLKPTDVEGLIIALVPLSNGFAVYTSVNVVLASYTQNARFPWLFRGVDNSKGIADIQHIASSGDEGTNYAWTSAGLQKISITGAITIMAEVTDFLSGKRFEDWNSEYNTISSSKLLSPMLVKLSFIGARYLVISYGALLLTHALVYDITLKRWGKLKIDHTACFEIAFNTDNAIMNSTNASAKTTLGFVTSSGEVKECDFENGTYSPDTVMILGKFSLLRSRMTTLQAISIEGEDVYTDNIELLIETTLDGKTPSIFTIPTLSNSNLDIKNYNSRVTGVNHSLIFKGVFNISSFQLMFNFNGRR